MGKKGAIKREVNVVNQLPPLDGEGQNTALSTTINATFLMEVQEAHARILDLLPGIDQELASALKSGGREAPFDARNAATALGDTFKTYKCGQNFFMHNMTWSPSPTVAFSKLSCLS